MFGCLTAAGYVSEIGLIYYPAIFGATIFMKKMIDKVDLNNREACDKFFRSNRYFGFVVLLSILLGKAFNNPKDKTPQKLDEN